MKKLTKIKLINWHIFINNTIEICDNTLITGENGQGKSTLLDAINYVLSGGKGKFNQAANANNSRSLTTYVKGKIGLEGQDYLRPEDDVISHIALEFYDDADKTSFVIGVIIELPLQSSKSKGEFYLITNSKIKDSYYLNDSVISDKRTFKTIIDHEKDKHISFHTKTTDIRNMLKSALGLSNNKYFELLPKALSFKPIDNIDSFVYDYLLQEQTVDIDALKQTMTSYRELRKMFDFEQEKYTHLLPLKDLTPKYRELVKEVDNILIFLKKIEITNIKNNISRNQKSKDNYSSKLRELSNEYLVIVDDISDKNTELENSKNNDYLRQIDNLENKITNYKSKLIVNKESITNLKSIINNVVNIANKLKIPQSFNKYLNLEDFLQIKVEAEDFQTKLNKANNEYNRQYINFSNERDNKTNELKEANNKLIFLKNKGLYYDERLNYLINGIKSELVNFYNDKSIEVKPLCEYLEIKEENEDWRNTLEGVLNTQRFDIIVDAKYFDKAIKVYDKIKNKYNIHGYGVVNLNKLEKTGTLAENSLALKVEGQSETARILIHNYLGSFTCVDNILDLKKFNRSVTKEGMKYTSHTARQINKRVWSTPFIGQQARLNQIETTENQIKELNILINKLNIGMKICEKNSNLINSSQLLRVFTYNDIFKEESVLTESLECAKKDIKKLKDDPLYASFEENIGRLKNEITKLKEQEKNISESIGAYKNKISDLEDNSSNLNNILEDLTKKYDNLVLELDTENKIIDLEKKYNFSSIKEYEETKNDLENIIKTDNKEISNQKISIERLMTLYTEKYDSNKFIPKIENLSSFMDELNIIETRNLIKFKDLAEVAYSGCEKEFKEDFLANLANNIENAKANIKKLNLILKQNPFGSDEEIYEFTTKRSSDKNFGVYYDIIISGEKYQISTLFDDSLSVESNLVLEELLRKLTTDDNTQRQAEDISKYTDYRHYMSYDIKVTNKENKTYFLSTQIKGKSGGETQTPFYVIIASSFEELFTRNSKKKSAASIVLFDEAFDKMDETRIEDMMEYYKKLKMQLIVAVPPGRINNIVNNVETTIGVTKMNNSAQLFSDNFNKKEVRLD